MAWVRPRSTAYALLSIENQLLRYVFEMREKRMGASIKMVLVEFCLLERKSSRLGTRYIKHHSFTRRMGIHKAQKAPGEISTKAKDYVMIV